MHDEATQKTNYFVCRTPWLTINLVRSGPQGKEELLRATTPKQTWSRCVLVDVGLAGRVKVPTSFRYTADKTIIRLLVGRFP